MSAHGATARRKIDWQAFLVMADRQFKERRSGSDFGRGRRDSPAVGPKERQGAAPLAARALPTVLTGRSTVASCTGKQTDREPPDPSTP
jgi:hypothetical protein